LRKPSVGTACPGIDEVIADGETGLLVAPADCEAIASAVGRLLGDEALAARMGEAGRRRAEGMFTQQAMAARAEEIYLRMIAAR
jgi:glycosyltransferase involved in cell wall biosynthesis